MLDCKSDGSRILIDELGVCPPEEEDGADEGI